MSIIVKKMNMPQNCMSCPLFSGQGCKATHKLFHDITNIAVRVRGCPLVELPETHGRLIDTDDVKDELIGAIPYIIDDRVTEAYVEGLGRAYIAIEDAPTIIEAEKDE